MTSLSTRFLGQPRLTKPIFIGKEPAQDNGSHRWNLHCTGGAVWQRGLARLLECRDQFGEPLSSLDIGSEPGRIVRNRDLLPTPAEHG